MVSKTNVFFTGATGYIGGAVLERFLARADVDTYNIRALVRSAEKAEKFKVFGVDTVVGSHDDVALVEKLASETDIFFSIADCDHVPAAKATLAGLKKRFEATGNVATLIHTSGTGVLKDDANGLYTYDQVYDDSDPESIESLAPTQPHRLVDLEIVAADQQGFVKTYIILPSTIYGIASGRFVDAGIRNPLSLMIPITLRASLDRGQAGVFGLGKNTWPNVHIDDTADLYMVLFDAITADPTKVGHGREGFFFAENGHHLLLDVSKAMGEVLVAAGRSKSAEPTTFTQEEINKYLHGTNFLGSNSRCVANRSRAIGWKPKYTTADFLASIKPELDFLVKRENL